MAKANQKRKAENEDAVRLPDPVEIKFEVTGAARAAVLRTMPSVRAQVPVAGSNKVAVRKLEPSDLHEIAKRAFLEWVRASDPATRY